MNIIVPRVGLSSDAHFTTSQVVHANIALRKRKLSRDYTKEEVVVAVAVSWGRGVRAGVQFSHNGVFFAKPNETNRFSHAINIWPGLR